MVVCSDAGRKILHPQNLVTACGYSNSHCHVDVDSYSFLTMSKPSVRIQMRIQMRIPIRRRQPLPDVCGFESDRISLDEVFSRGNGETICLAKGSSRCQ